MAGGLVAWGDDRVSATSDLGVPVRDAIIEPRRDDPAPDRRPRRRSRPRRHGHRGPLVRPARRGSLVCDGADPGRVERSPTTTSATGSSSAPTTARSSCSTRAASTASRARSSRPSSPRPRRSASRRRDRASSTRAATAGRSSSRRRTAGSSRSTPTRPRRSATSSSQGSRRSPRAARARSSRRRPGAVEDPAAAAAVLADLLGGDAATYEARLKATEDGDDRRRHRRARPEGEHRRRDRRRAAGRPRGPGRAARRDRRREGRDVHRRADRRRRDEHRRSTAAAFGLAYVTGRRRRGCTSTTGGTDEGAPGEIATILVGGEHGEGRPDPPGDDARCPARGSRSSTTTRREMVHVLGRSARRRGLDDLRHRAARRTGGPSRRRAAAVRPGRRSSWTTNQTYPTDDRQQILAFAAERPGRDRRHRPPRVRLARARRPRRRR